MNTNWKEGEYQQEKRTREDTEGECDQNTICMH